MPTPSDNSGAIPPEHLTLHNRTWLLQTAKPLSWVLVALMAGLAALGPIVIVWVTGERPPPEVVEKWFAALKKGLTDEPEDWFMLAFIFIGGPLSVVYSELARRYERVILDPGGMTYVSPLPDFLQKLQPSWSLRWDQVRHASLQRPVAGTAPQFITLVLKTVHGRRKLRPFSWVDPAHFQPPSIRTMFHRRASASWILEEIQNGPLLRYIHHRATQVRLDPDAPTISNGFAIEKNPVSLTFAILFFALFGYALLDTFVFNPEDYVGRPFYDVYIGAGIIAALISAIVMIRTHVPAVESAIIGVLVGGVLGSSLHSGLLRVNQITDTTGLQAVEYTIEIDAVARLTPVEPQFPVVVFDQNLDYWRQPDLDVPYTLYLRRGGLGFYQYDLQRVRDAYRDYYQNKKR